MERGGPHSWHPHSGLEDSGGHLQGSRGAWELIKLLSSDLRPLGSPSLPSSSLWYTECHIGTPAKPEVVRMEET